MSAEQSKNTNTQTCGEQSRTKDEILAAAEAGIDIAMLEDNLNRSPAERIKRHQIAFNTAEKLRKAISKQPTKNP